MNIKKKRLQKFRKIICPHITYYVFNNIQFSVLTLYNYFMYIDCEFVFLLCTQIMGAEK